MKPTTLIIAALVAPFATACGDITRATGELGNLEYELFTDYEMGLARLDEVAILTGHTQTLYLDLADEDDADRLDLSTVHHAVSPSAGVTLDYHADEDGLFDLDILVEQPGEYTLTTEIEGEVFDYVYLRFDAPTALESATWVRAPGAEDFERAPGDGLVIAEGTQISFVPIPLDAGGDRIVGRIAVVTTSDPAEATVPSFTDLGTYEDGVVGSIDTTSVYVIEPGPLTMMLTDEPNGVTFEQVFDVR
ncbi:MAG: hypothetical protein ABIO70_06335 [Pseudomonadota bacterium]